MLLLSSSRIVMCPKKIGGCLIDCSWSLECLFCFEFFDQFVY